MWDFLNKKCFQLGVCSRFTMYEYGLTLAIIGKKFLIRGDTPVIFVHMCKPYNGELSPFKLSELTFYHLSEPSCLIGGVVHGILASVAVYNSC